MYKLVLVDIDGTLLNDDHQVTEETRTAIKKLKDYGIMFGIATGRSPYAIFNLMEEWGLKGDIDLILGFNGSCFYNTQTQELTSVYQLERQGIQEILEDFKDFDINAGTYDKQEFHAIRDDALGQNIAKSNHFSFVLDDLSGYDSVGKILLVGEKEEMDKVVEHASTLHPKNYTTFRSADILLECIHPELSKSKGISLMIQSLNIKNDEILTFGDMMNDYDMIKDYVGVAMGNADPRVKEVATYITDTNNESGIATFLNRYIYKDEV